MTTTATRRTVDQDYYPAGATTAELERMADNMGVTIQYAPNMTRWGRYQHSTRTITLLAGLARVQKRCTLAHELAHAMLCHADGIPEWERDADILAARLIITPDDWELMRRDWHDWGEDDHDRFARTYRIMPRLAGVYAEHIAQN